MTSDLMKLPDVGLEFLQRRLEEKLAALKLATSAVAQAMFEAYTEQFAAVRRELERRATP
jgi:hypothetical protein